jgi:hypothetical protein
MVPKIINREAIERHERRHEGGQTFDDQVQNAFRIAKGQPPLGTRGYQAPVHDPAQVAVYAEALRKLVNW